MDYELVIEGNLQYFKHLYFITRNIYCFYSSMEAHTTPYVIKNFQVMLA